MNIARFKIGDRVIVKDYKDIPEESRNKGVARLCGKVGTITNKLQYECGGRTVYMLRFAEIGRGHGHIIHEGAKGVAQASAYALKKIFEKMNGGSLTNV